MQVLLAFVDARGAVLTRDDLIRSCWSGAVVGDDAVNRTVAEIRRIARTTQSGFGIETIPRVGYRLSGIEPGPVEPSAVPPVLIAEAPSQQPSRRWLLGAAVLGTGAIALAAWQLRKPVTDPRFLELMSKGREALRQELTGSSTAAAVAFREAVTLEPESAEAWGLLALALQNASNVSQPQGERAGILESERAARRALALNAREPNALVTLALMQRSTDTWLDTEHRMREVLAIDPSNMAALDYLTGLLQAAGYIQESREVNDRAAAADPLRPAPQWRRALKLWIMGRGDEADQAIARAAQLWPRNLIVRSMQLLITAFTNRWQAARLTLEGNVDGQALLAPAGMRMWNAGLQALETRSAQDVAAARDTALTAAPLNPAISVHAVMLMSALGEVDAAYSVVEGLILRRGLHVTRDGSENSSEYEIDVGWRETQWLFTPATKPLRQDSRFDLLADVIGMSQYWQQRGVLPDERANAA